MSTITKHDNNNVNSWPRVHHEGDQAGSFPAGEELEFHNGNIRGSTQMVPQRTYAIHYQEHMLPQSIRDVRNDIINRAVQGQLPLMTDLGIWSNKRGPASNWSRCTEAQNALAYDLAITRYHDGSDHRFALRLQVPYRIKKTPLRQIKDELQRQYGSAILTEVVWIGEVKLHGAERRSSTFQDWQIGSSLSVPTGPSGRLTVFLRRKDEEARTASYALTAGHILRDGNNVLSPNGEIVYHPSLDGAPTAANTQVATVESVHFRAARGRNAARSEDAPIPLIADWGLLKLKGVPQSPGDLPESGTLSGLFKFIGDDPLPLNTEIFKVKGASPKSKGFVGGSDSQVMFRSPAGVAYVASGLIEVKGDGSAFSDHGDSGSLVMVSGKKAVGLIVMGTSRGVLTGAKNGVSYIAPLEPALQELGMELAL